MKVRKLSNVGRDRNNRMWSRLETDPAYCDLARRIWTQGWQPLAQDTEPTRQHVLGARDTQLQRAIAANVKLRQRGVAVVFVPLPNAGHYASSQPDFAPPPITWDM